MFVRYLNLLPKLYSYYLIYDHLITLFLVEKIHSVFISNSILEYIDYGLSAEFLIELFKKQPNYVINNIMHFNILFVFLDNIDYPRVLDLLQIILAPHHPEKDINEDLTTRVWKYCRNLDFFDLMGTKLLHGIPINPKVIQIKNKPMDRTLIKVTQPDLISKDTIKLQIVDAELPPHTFPITEECYMLKYDLDRIMSLLRKIIQKDNVVEYIDIERIDDFFLDHEDIMANGHLRLGFLVYDSIAIKEMESKINTERQLFFGSKHRNDTRDSFKIMDHDSSDTEEKSSFRASFTDSVKSLALHSPNASQQLQQITNSKDQTISKKRAKTNFLNKKMEKMKKIDFNKLHELYPSDFYDFITEPEEIDRIDLTSSPNKNKQDNGVPEIKILDLLDYLIFNMELSPSRLKPQAPKYMMDQNINFKELVTALFDFGEGGIFKPLLFTFLIRIFDDIENQDSTAWRAAKLVNRMLELSLDKSSHLFPYAKVMARVSRKCFVRIMKSLLNLFILKEDKVVTLDHARVPSYRAVQTSIILKTFLLVLKADFRNNYKMLGQVYSNVWHVIILIFFQKKWNSTISNLSFSIIRLILTYGNRNTIITLVFKLNFFSLALNIVKDIDPGEEAINIAYDILIFNLRRICRLFKYQLENRQELQKIADSITTTLSYSELNKTLFTATIYDKYPSDSTELSNSPVGSRKGSLRKSTLAT